MALAASIVLGAVGILWAYEYAATKGFLGEEARQKYVSESSGAYGVLLGGRGDVLGALAAIHDSPILGHGSWAKDWSYILAQQEAMALMGYQDAGEIFARRSGRRRHPGALVPSSSLGMGGYCWSVVLGVGLRADGKNADANLSSHLSCYSP